MLAEPTSQTPTRPGDQEAADRFIEQMGLLLQNDRLPRIAGRIWGLLIYDGRVFGLQEMADRLQVSRASISTNARLLAEYGLIRRVGRPGSRQDYYELSPDPYGRMLQVVVQRIEEGARAITEAATNIPLENHAARARVGMLHDFYAKTHALMDKIIGEVGRR